MGFVIAVGLILAGYTLVDWGHYVASGHAVSMWYLISGKTQQEKASQKSSTSKFDTLKNNPTATATGLGTASGDAASRAQATANATATGLGTVAGDIARQFGF